MVTDRVFDNVFLSVGAMKAGTTWLYDVFHRHPDLHFSHEKEIHYFYACYHNPGILSDRSRMRRAKGYLHFDPEKSMQAPLHRRVRWTANWLAAPVDDAWFNDLFLNRGAARWICDFSNLNALLSANAWREIHARTGRLRVLYTLRDPIDRIWSHVRFHLKMQGKGDLLDQWSLDDLVAHIETPGSDYLDHTDYVRAITRMQTALPADCLMVDFFDRIGADPRGLVRDVETHLGVTHVDLPGSMIAKVVNPSPPRPMPPGLADRLTPFAEAQIDGLARLGIVAPTAWRRKLR
jgi:hypothetical protein